MRRKEKQEDDVHGLAINGVKIDGVLEADQSAEWLLQIRYPRMRDGHAADADVWFAAIEIRSKCLFGKLTSPLNQL